MKMRRINRLWIPVLLGVVLIATLVGAASARPNARPLAQPWRVLAISSRDCIPTDDADDWEHHDRHLECGAATCAFVCPVVFPAAGEQAVGAVNVKRLTVYIYDNAGGVAPNVYLDKTYPLNGSVTEMAKVQTTDASATDPQTIMDTSIVANPVYRVQVPSLWVSLLAGNIRFYGAFIHYTW
jgi:hypothetical protein